MALKSIFKTARKLAGKGTTGTERSAASGTKQSAASSQESVTETKGTGTETKGTADAPTEEKAAEAAASASKSASASGSGSASAKTFASSGTETGTESAASDETAARKTALERLTELEDAETPTYTGSRAEAIEAALQQLSEREAFNYDVNADPLYRQYEDSFTRNGTLAAEDAAGRAAALTGGYGSTYAQQAGQQAYGEYAAALADKVPSLYEAAYERYLDEDDALREQLETLLSMDDTEYDRWRDSVTDAQTDRDYWYKRMLSDQEQENYLTELYQKYPSLNPNATTKKSSSSKSSSSGSGTTGTTTAANCEKFVAGLSKTERAAVYSGTDAKSAAYRKELIASLGESGYEALKKKYPA